MGKVQVYGCDNCHRVLFGQDRGSYKSENYVQIKGQITLQLKDEDTQRRYYVHITPRADSEMTFCWESDRSKQCLMEAIETELELYHNRRKAHLMAEVSYHGGVQNMPARAYPNGTVRVQEAPRYQAPAPAPRPQSTNGS